MVKISNKSFVICFPWVGCFVLFFATANSKHSFSFLSLTAPLEFEYEPKDEEQDKGMLVVSLGATVLYSKKDQGQLKTQAQLEEVVRRLTDAMQVAHSL